MPLLKDLAAATNRANGEICSVAALYESLPDEERRAVRDKIDTHARDRLDGTIIAEILSKNGYEIGAESIQRHRRGACKCPGF